MKRLLTGVLDWTDARFPLSKLWKEHLAEYYAPKNFNFWYFFGSLALVVLVLQLVTGIWLTMNYKPDAEFAFASVEYIMRDVDWGWLMRYLHSTGASAFFIVVYLHMFRALIYGSFKEPRELLWLVGMFIYLALMAEAFMGYLLPWGQMSYWGAQVIISLFGAIPFGIGEELALWIRGDYVISDATLNRFFALHVVALPLVLVGLVFVHILALHEVGSNNPDGIEIKKNKDADGIPLDGIPFHPYYTVKDIVGVVVFLFLFLAVVFFFPEFNGWFLEKDNFIPADPLKTPEHIVPLWYFTPYYAILRAIPDKLTGVLAMGVSIVVLFFLPWIDRHPIRSIRYRSMLYKLLIALFVITFVFLGYLGTQPPTAALSELGFRFSELYFAFFVILWLYSRERSRSVHLRTLIVFVVILALADVMRFDPNRAVLMMVSALIPLAYLVAFVLGPIYTRLNESQPLPERVVYP
jgi:ubiquinol-cytochrome c reductase cytochrome b subunit